MNKKDYYKILELEKNATADEIKIAFRKLARKYHPDVTGGDEASNEKFKNITEAYEILSNTQKKKDYDTLQGFYSYAEGEVKSKQKQANKAYKETRKQDSSTNNHKNVFEDILYGLKKAKQEPAKRGTDIYSDITISMSDAKQGCERTVNILHTDVCPNCKGRKFINGTKCPLCKGSGEETTHKKLKVKIPPNVKHGSKIRIANEGNRGYNGGRNGDLFLNIKIEANPIFSFDDNTILLTIPIQPYEAVLGADITVPTLDGHVIMKIMPNTISGQKYRLQNQGLTKDNQKGDMIVTIQINIPKNLSENEKKLYEDLKKASTRNIRENI